MDRLSRNEPPLLQSEPDALDLGPTTASVTSAALSSRQKAGVPAQAGTAATSANRATTVSATRTPRNDERRLIIDLERLMVTKDPSFTHSCPATSERDTNGT